VMVFPVRVFTKICIFYSSYVRFFNPMHICF
jgi:hypothetical protein